MKFLLFVEGHTERRILSDLLKRWLDPRLPSPVGIHVVRFEGINDYYAKIQRTVELNLSGKMGTDIIAAIGLIDLYGPTLYPNNKRTAKERYAWLKEHLEGRVNHPHFHQHLAVHETEAWLLAEPDILPQRVKNALPGKHSRPEAVNFDEPPAKLLARLYREKLGKGYRKIIDGVNLFQSLSVEVAYEKCPALKALLDDMLELARQAIG